MLGYLYILPYNPALPYIILSKRIIKTLLPCFYRFPCPYCLSYNVYGWFYRYILKVFLSWKRLRRKVNFGNIGIYRSATYSMHFLTEVILLMHQAHRIIFSCSTTNIFYALNRKYLLSRKSLKSCQFNNNYKSCPRNQRYFIGVLTVYGKYILY